MKKNTTILLTLPLLFSFYSCDKTSSDSSSSAIIEDDSSEEVYYDLSSDDSLYLSNVSGNFTDENATKYIRFKVSQDGEYGIMCFEASSLEIYNEHNQLLKSGDIEYLVSLKKGEDIYVKIMTSSPNEIFNIEILKNDGELITLPYEINNTIDYSKFELDNDSPYSSIEASPIEYVKRDNGTYVYCNNPEKLSEEDIGAALQKNSGLTGEVYMTLEHSNFSNQNIYLGYQLENETNSPIYVTVKNIGYQTEGRGSWLGQQAWCDFYNTKFQVPQRYLDGTADAASLEYFKSFYNFDDYSPRIYIPTTYVIPAHKTFYVMGGTTSDSYNQINVDETANILIRNGACINGNVLFDVKGGSVTGTLYCYTDPTQVAAKPAYQGYITKRGDTRYGAQYKGIGHHAGIVDNSVAWAFNDNTSGGYLPVSYSNSIDSTAKSTKNEPYSAYVSKIIRHDYESSWVTNINPQANNQAVGTDMVAFECALPDGTPLVLDNEHAGDDGYPGNFGNWMIEYQDNYVFVNQGDKPRTIKIQSKDSGTLAMLVRDETGAVLKSDYTFGQIKDFGYYEFELVVPAHTIKTYTFDYCLVANGNGGIFHTINLFRAI